MGVPPDPPGLGENCAKRTAPHREIAPRDNDLHSIATLRTWRALVAQFRPLGFAWGTPTLGFSRGDPHPRLLPGGPPPSASPGGTPTLGFSRGDPQRP
ncbi:hypothetical protein GCM10010195_66530 [Kitasatospora griseola]|nr:hypothetical protein GCM10010195_66530 [Kitasatospora griseola]